MSKTIVKPHKYAKHELFAVFTVTESGAESEKPVVSFGMKKAEAIVNHLEELKKFVEDNK